MKIIKLKPKYTEMKENFLSIDIKDSKCYKGNAINADLNRAAWIVSTFTQEIPTITRKFLNPDYPLRLVNSAIKQSNEKSNGNSQDDYIISPDFFDIMLVLAEIPYCPRNETFSNRFIKKFHELSTIHTKLE